MIELVGGIIMVFLTIIGYFVVKIDKKVDNTYKDLTDNILQQTRYNDSIEYRIKKIEDTTKNIIDDVNDIKNRIKHI